MYEARHQGSTTVAMRSTVGAAAKWTVTVSDTVGLQNKLWSPLEKGGASDRVPAKIDADEMAGTERPPHDGRVRSHPVLGSPARGGPPWHACRRTTNNASAWTSRPFRRWPGMGCVIPSGQSVAVTLKVSSSNIGATGEAPGVLCGVHTPESETCKHRRRWATSRSSARSGCSSWARATGGSRASWTAVDHPAASEALGLLQQGRRRQAHAVLEAALAQLAGAPNGNGLAWFRNAGM